MNIHCKEGKKYTHMNNIIATKNLMENIEVDLTKVKKLMKSQDVRKAPGSEGVSDGIMKECGNQLTGKLHSIIESSLKETRVPLDWKRANIVPIHTGYIEEPLNYITMSLTSIVAEIYEKIMGTWLKFLEKIKTLTVGNRTEP